MIAACVFAEKELAYLRSQPLGRLATVAPDGQPDNAAVGFRVEDDGTIVVTGMNLADSRKGRNVADGNPKVAFIVDALESVDPWDLAGSVSWATPSWCWTPVGRISGSSPSRAGVGKSRDPR